MMTSIWYDVKSKLKDGNPLWWLIIICVVVFLIDNTLGLVWLASGNAAVGVFLHRHFGLPLYLSTFLHQPWTIFTYTFLHADLFHIFINLFMLYWFGEIYSLYLGQKHLFKIMLGGTVTGGLVALLTYQFAPFLHNPLAILVGASAAVEAVIFAATALNPEHEVRLFIFGRVQLKYIAFFSLVLNFISIAGTNAGGVLAHLGGALWGYVFIKQIQNGVDLLGVFDKIANLFKPKSKLKVSYRAEAAPILQTPPKSNTSKQLDDILDKINVSGYDSLTKAEKQFLFEYSNKD
jgi:membrane associated rhomboid family serine protease